MVSEETKALIQAQSVLDLTRQVLALVDVVEVLRGRIEKLERGERGAA